MDIISSSGISATLVGFLGWLYERRFGAINGKGILIFSSLSVLITGVIALFPTEPQTHDLSVSDWLLPLILCLWICCFLVYTRKGPGKVFPEVRQPSNPVWLRYLALSGMLVIPLFILPALNAVLSIRVRGGAQAIAVLPFEGRDRPALRFVAGGIVESTLAKLSGCENVRVPSGVEIDDALPQISAQGIARQLGSDKVIRGTIREENGTLTTVIWVEDFRRHWWWSPFKISSSGDQQQFAGVLAEDYKLDQQIGTAIVRTLNLKCSEDRILSKSDEARWLYSQGLASSHGQTTSETIERTISFYQRALKQDAKFAAAQARLGDTYLAMFFLTHEMSWLDRAVQSALAAADEDKNVPEAHLALGSAYTATGRIPEALTSLRRALELIGRYEHSDEGYRRLGRAYQEAGQPEEAIRALEKAVRINPYYWNNFSQLGEAYYNTGNYAAAAGAFREVADRIPQRAIGYERWGVALYQQENYKESIAKYRQALKLEPLSRTYSNLGAAFNALNRYDEAAENYLKATQKDPKNYVAFGNLGDSYRSAGRHGLEDKAYTQAIALAEERLTVNSRNSLVMGRQAYYYAKRNHAGDLIKAAEKADQALAINHANPEILYCAAIVKVLSGKTDEALKDFREALQHNYPLKEIEHDPDLVRFRSLPQFIDLLHELHLKQ